MMLLHMATVAYFLCLSLMKNPLIFFFDTNVDLGHMHIMPTMDYCRDLGLLYFNHFLI